jgi:hypothetical protein
VTFSAEGPGFRLSGEWCACEGDEDDVHDDDGDEEHRRDGADDGGCVVALGGDLEQVEELQGSKRPSFGCEAAHSVSLRL